MVLRGFESLRQGFLAWALTSVNRRIFLATLTISCLSGFVALAGVGRDLVIAYKFGVGKSTDAFMLAILLPSLFVQVAAGSLATALTPAYVRLRVTEGSEAARRLAANGLAMGSLVLLTVMILLALLGPFLTPVVASGFDTQTLHLTIQLFLALLPFALIQGVLIMWGGLINAGERFALVALAPGIRPLLSIILLLLLADTLGVQVLVIALLFGACLEAVLLGRLMIRFGLPLLPRWSGFDPATRQVIAQYGPIIGSGIIGTGNLLISQGMAATFDPGCVSALGFASKLVVLLVGLGSMPLGVAILPYFSRLASAGDWDSIRHSLTVWIKWIFLVSVPVTIVLFAFSEDIVRLVFQRGSFTPEHTALVSRIQAFYVLQIPFILTVTVTSGLLSALQMNRHIMVISLISFVANIAGNLVFMRHFGVTGIALSASVAYALSMVLSFYAVWRFFAAQQPGPTAVPLAGE